LVRAEVLFGKSKGLAKNAIMSIHGRYPRGIEFDVDGTVHGEAFPPAKCFGPLKGGNGVFIRFMSMRMP